MSLLSMIRIGWMGSEGALERKGREETSFDATGETALALERAAAVMNEMEVCRTRVCSIFVWVSRFLGPSDGFLDDDLTF